MVMILYAIYIDFEHVKDKLLICHEVPSIESLTTRILRVPTLQSMNVHEPLESFVMVSTYGRKGCNARGERAGKDDLNARNVKEWIMFKRTVFLCMDSLTRQLISIKLKLLGLNSQ